MALQTAVLVLFSQATLIGSGVLASEPAALPADTDHVFWEIEWSSPGSADDSMVFGLQGCNKDANGNPDGNWTEFYVVHTGPGQEGGASSNWYRGYDTLYDFYRTVHTLVGGYTFQARITFS